MESLAIPSGAPSQVKHVRRKVRTLEDMVQAELSTQPSVEVCVTARPPWQDTFPCACGQVLWCKVLPQA